VSANSEGFDAWIRSSFVEMNTALEDIYFAQSDRSKIDGVGDDLKTQILEDGRGYIVKLVKEGNTDEGFENAHELLGNLGFYMASLRRHEMTNPAREETSPLKEASALGLHIGASLGVTPRFATSHLASHNYAKNGIIKSFTSLNDEFLFLKYNTLSMFAFKRAADALKRIVPMGVSNPVSLTLFENAADALGDVLKVNKILFAELDVDRFFWSVRPYYKPYRVGRQEYRGANAGDFAGINELDLLLGLCRGNDPYYAQMLVDKMLFLLPEDQVSLRDCLRQRPLLDEFLSAAESSKDEPWFKEHAAVFLKVCKLHGAIAAQHHNSLVDSFITRPSTDMDKKNLTQITASGPPLPVLLKSLEILRDMRLAAKRSDIRTSFAEIEQLKKAVGG
jgi:monodechloroaminopyrrolnitrin synthase PrnB-like protein